MRAFVTVDVFTEHRFGGNPLAVFPDASGLSDGEMQSLAAEFNLSETAFVLPPDDPANTARVRIFTPRHELPFAGHPNVGTGYVLARSGPGKDVLVFEEAAGLVEVRVERDGSGAPTGATIAAPRPLCLDPGPTVEEVAACAGLAATDIRTGAHLPVLASVGTTFVIAEVDPSALACASPQVGAFGSLAGVALHLYARQDRFLRARVFAPLSGIVEDPATGSANATLAALLLSLTDDPSGSFEITQGTEIGRPSLLRATARRIADGIRATVGGACVAVLRGEALLDEDRGA